MTGQCVAESDVLYVSPSGGSASSCTRMQPCALTQAVALADAARKTVKMTAGNYTASVVVNGKDVAFHGDGATLNAPAGAPAMDVQQGAHVRVEGLDIVNLGTSVAVYCNGSPQTPSLDVVDASVDSVGTPFVFQGCTGAISRSTVHCRTSTTQIILAAPTTNLTINRSILDGGDGVWADGANSLVRVTNSLITNQTGPNGAFVGSNLFGNGPGSVTVSFSTVIGSIIKCGASASSCAGGTGTGSCIDNSIVFASALNPSADVVQGACTVNYSLVTPQSTALAGSNNLPGAEPQFKSASGDYHLQASSPAVDAGDPAATNNADYDGVTRPQGARRDMGAFEYK
jgi:hypothetical protein